MAGPKPPAKPTDVLVGCLILFVLLLCTCGGLVVLFGDDEPPATSTTTTVTVTTTSTPTTTAPTPTVTTTTTTTTTPPAPKASPEPEPAAPVAPVVPTRTTTPAPPPPPPSQPAAGTPFANCTAARAAGAAPVRRGDPGYGRHLDRDGDGVGCE